MAAREPEARGLLSGAQPVDSNDPLLTKTFPMLPWDVKGSVKPDLGIREDRKGDV